MLISNEINHIDTFYNLLDLLLAKGLDNESLKKNIIKPPNTDERWESFLSANNVSTVKDELLRSKIDSLHFIDQYFRKKEGSYKTYGDTIKIIDSLNMDFLYNLVLNDQFPVELEIGVRNFASRQGYDIVFHHYAQGTSENMKQKITPIIINLVLQGKILPNKAAQWLELQNDEFSAGVFDILSFKVDNKSTDYYVSNYTKERKLYINQYRKLLGMESLDEYHKKFIFKLNNPSSKYIFDLQKNIFHLDKDTFEKVIKGMRRLESR